ncbi:endonuclease VII domain-containing protein [Streptomyces violascens]|uniref:endonuclease VII domain-containing protein n=1 Tax=Streptomyces violascens TaxID=67381 RepID=UPI0036C2B7A9
MESSSTQTCSACGETKPDDDFYMQSTNPDHRAYGRRQRRCKICVRKQTGAYQRENRERATELQRAWRFKNSYGITLHDYDRLLLEQGGVCAICQGPSGSASTRLHVDHCHVTGRVRGLLCRPCNKGIGAFRDRSGAIRSAISYLTGGVDE